MSNKYFDDFFDYAHIFLIRNILNASQGATHNTNKGDDGVPEFGVGIFEQLQQEIKPLIFLNLEQVIPDQLIHKILPQLRGNLQGIDSET